MFFLNLEFITFLFFFGNSFTNFVNISTHIIIVHWQIYIPIALLKSNLILVDFLKFFQKQCQFFY